MVFGHKRYEIRGSSRSRRLGTVRRFDCRNADAYLRSSPEMVRVINEAIGDVEEGRYVIGSREEVKARVERWNR